MTSEAALRQIRQRIFDYPPTKGDQAMTLTIQTDHKWKPFLYRYEVPASILEDQFDHLPEDEYGDGFIRYRGRYYHTSDFLRIEHNEALKDWQGYSSDSYFSGVVMNLSDDGEAYQIGTYCS